MTNKAKGFGKSSMPTKAQRRDWAERTARGINEHGRAIIGVIGNGEDAGESTPGWAYTIGNSITQDIPEVITFYPSRPTQSFVLNEFSDRLKDGVIEPFKQGEAREVFGCLGEEGEIPLRARLMTPTEQVLAHEHFTCQIPETVPVIILELPDPKGYFADEDDCADVVKAVYEHVPHRVRLSKEAN